MIPVTLRTGRLVLDQPTAADVDAITEYCQDPLFEAYLTTPWPYARENAVQFVESYVPAGWADGSEYTWALRVDGVFLGVIGARTGPGDVGFWLGAPFRRRGYMAEALGAVADWWFASLGRDALRWECVVGNTASAATARAAGFMFAGVAPAEMPSRDGSLPQSWHGIRRASDVHAPKHGWPV